MIDKEPADCRCGGKPLIDEFDSMYSRDITEYCITCEDCEITLGRTYTDWEEALDIWNKVMT